MHQGGLDMLWVVVCAGLVMLMQAGFLCLESGRTRTKNSINVAVKNLTDFALSVFLFWAIGFGVMFGLSDSGWIGTSMFFVDSGQEGTWTSTFFLFQAMFCGTAVTIVAGAVAERMSFKGYLIITVFVSILVYPLFGHWAWGGALDGEPGWLASMGFIDFAGSTVVHSVGGWVALAAIMVIGPRLGRFTDDRNAYTIAGQNLPTAMLGALLLCFGWIGFNGGSTFAWGENVPGIVANTMLAGVSGLLAALTVGWVRDSYPDPMKILNGLLAGLVAITANCHIVTAVDSVVIGAGGGLCMLLADQLLDRWKLDDVVGSFPVHAAAGIWGTIAVALLGDIAAFSPGFSRLDQLQVQLLGVAVCALMGFLPTYLFLHIVRSLTPLRVSMQSETIGLNASEHRASTEHLDLLREMEAQSQRLDLNRRVPVEPYTEIGQIAAKYNELLDSLQETVAINELVIRDTRDGIVTCSLSGKILAINPSAEYMFGCDDENLSSRSIWSFIDTDSSASFNSVETLVEHCQSPTGSMETLRFVGIRKSGDRFPVEIEATTGKLMEEDVVTFKISDKTIAVRNQESLTRAKVEAERARDSLQEKVDQIEAFNRLAVDRESRMMDLKEQINQLCLELDRSPPYFISEN